MGALPRARCPICGRSVAVRRNSTYREHRPHMWQPQAICKGSGRPIVSPPAPIPPSSQEIASMRAMLADDEQPRPRRGESPMEFTGRMLGERRDV